MHEQIAGEEASAYAALVLGTRDYVRKCGFQQAIIGLSGGIDSALTAASRPTRSAPENVIGVGMPGPYSSQGSIDDARALAKNLGIRFEVPASAKSSKHIETTLQKVFAECRKMRRKKTYSPAHADRLLMALSNKFGAIGLSTGNKSELGVGYCTLYGDMVGGLAVITDVPKTLVYRLSHYVNSRKRGDPERHSRSRRRLSCVPIRRILTRCRRTTFWMRSSKTMWKTCTLRNKLPRNTTSICALVQKRHSHGGSRRVQAPAGGART